MRVKAWALLLCACVAAVPVVAAAGAADPDSLLSRVMAQGHLQARANGSGGVEAGPLFTLGELQVRSRPGFTPAALGIAGYAGQPASAENIRALGETLRLYLLDHGFPFAEVALDFAPRPGLPVADLRIGIEAGKGFKYGGTKAAGSRTKPEALERMSLLTYGETYSETRLRLARERLARTGYYEAILPGGLFRDSTRNMLYPTLAITDLKGNRLGGLFGYDSEGKDGQGLNGFLDIHLINLRGTARDVDFGFESKRVGGAPEKEARLAYTEPWILGTPVGGRIDLQISLQDSVYDETNREIGLFQDLDFHSRYLIALAWQDNRDYATGERSSASIAGLGGVYDNRDRAPGTTRGLRASLRVNGVRRDLGDSTYYLVQSLNELGLWAGYGRWVGHVLLSSSGNWPLAGRQNRGELYELGGANSIRGFREKEFITNLFAYANMELQFLLAPASGAGAGRSRASVFVVPAFINRLDGLSGDIHWRRTAGYGVGLESGAKDWTFGLSYALNPDRPIGNGFLHMRVINNF